MLLIDSYVHAAINQTAVQIWAQVQTLCVCVYSNAPTKNINL